jgi:hypothetical protein
MAKRCSKRRRTRRGGETGGWVVPVWSGGYGDMARTRRRTRRGGGGGGGGGEVGDLAGKEWFSHIPPPVTDGFTGGGRKKMARTRRRTRRGGFKFTPYDGVNDI